MTIKHLIQHFVFCIRYCQPILSPFLVFSAISGIRMNIFFCLISYFRL